MLVLPWENNACLKMFQLCLENKIGLVVSKELPFLSRHDFKTTRWKMKTNPTVCCLFLLRNLMELKKNSWEFCLKAQDSIIGKFNSKQFQPYWSSFRYQIPFKKILFQLILFITLKWEKRNYLQNIFKLLLYDSMFIPCQKSSDN